jgi:hypothetical protein
MPLARNQAGLLTPRRVKANSLSGVIGLAGLGRVTAQVTGLAQVKLG